jgi:hypothetical protein
MTHTLQDLRDALAAEPDDVLAPPDLDSVVARGRLARRRRTTVRGAGAVAALVLVVAGAADVADRLEGGSATGTVLASPDAVAVHAAQARAAQAVVDARVSRFVDAPLERGAWSGTRPDGEQGSRALPRDDREWATLQWLRVRADLPDGGSLFVSTDNQPASQASGGLAVGREHRACTRVYLSCTTRRVASGVVAIEHGRTDDGQRGLRASFTPDAPDGSWVLVEVTTPRGDPAPYTADQLAELATDPAMSLPVPLATDELPDR